MALLIRLWNGNGLLRQISLKMMFLMTFAMKLNGILNGFCY